ncbi:unnamed protein product [Pedinophyceae sp. YPF-701]|nr:unnamed protein product [Pedinophyceae sp. YPF-701]
MAALTSSKVIIAQQKATRSVRPRAVAARAQSEDVSRRAALAGFAGVAALVLKGDAAQAAYGEGANVFGKTTNKSGFVTYAGDGYAFLIPARWNPSPERDNQNVILRYEDNGDSVNNVIITKTKTDKTKMEDLGSPEEFVASIAGLLGQQAWIGDTVSEGGFANGKTSAASLLDVGKETDKKGKTYYTAYVLTRSADGNEGGRHHLIKATISNGNLYVAKFQAGDKRWFKGVNKEIEAAVGSFQVA